jgi:hypothetical protein
MLPAMPTQAGQHCRYAFGRRTSSAVVSHVPRYLAHSRAAVVVSLRQRFNNARVDFFPGDSMNMPRPRRFSFLNGYYALGYETGRQPSAEVYGPNGEQGGRVSADTVVELLRKVADRVARLRKIAGLSLK